MEKIVFLDIDGVLNSNYWNECHQREISDGTLIDEEKVHLLAELVRRTNAKIVLHSGWRMWFDKELKPLQLEAQRLLDFLEKENLELDGITPDLTTEEIRKTKKFSLVKAEEILAYLEMHSEVSEWVVLDDLDLHNEQVAMHQVKTNDEIGLTFEDVIAAEKILNKNEVIKDKGRN